MCAVSQIFCCHQSVIVPRIPTYIPVPECTRDDECPWDRSCINQLCVSPCSTHGICASGSFCHTENHKPVCRCPLGFEGDPLTECRPSMLYIILID